MFSTKSHIKIALFYLLVTAMLGLLLRLIPITNFTANYRFIVHTHSHIALLGWVYLALTSILFHIAIPIQKKKIYNKIFWCTQATIIGMLCSFPFIGYAVYSIIFSTLFILCSYWFYFFFKKNHHLNKDTISYKFINISILFMVVSSIGPWLLGIIMNTLGSTSHWYKNAIYFYLHFQYNGWFLFCLIGILFYILEKNKVNFSLNKSKQFYKYFSLSCLGTLLLSFLWIQPNSILFIIAIIAALTQIIAAFIFNGILKNISKKLKEIFGAFQYRILQFIFGLLFLKVGMQLVSGFPYFSEITYKYIDFVIGYLHLTFLGIITLSLFVFLGNLKLIKLPKIWTKIYLLGFLLSELLIFYKGIAIYGCNLLIPIIIFCI